MSRREICWLLDRDDLYLPVAYRDYVSAVLQLHPPTRLSLLGRFFSSVADWDIRRGQRQVGEQIAPVIIGALSDLDERVPDGAVWVCSSEIELALDLARYQRRPVYWLSTDGAGATSRRRDHASWRARRPSCAVVLSELAPDGAVRQCSSLELRIDRNSPAITQQMCLMAGVSLIRALVAGQPTSELAGGKDIDSGTRPVQPSRGVTLWNRASLGLDIVRRTPRFSWRGSRNAVDHWRIGLASSPGSGGASSSLIASLPPASSFRWLPDKRAAFVADPMLAEISGKPALLYEQMEHSTRRTKLLARPLNEVGEPTGEPVVILERPFHLSFPGVVKNPAEPGFIYLLPEQAGTGMTVLYRAVETTGLAELDFKEHAVLLDDTPGIDPILQQVNGVWFLFVTDGRCGNSDNNLHLYTSYELCGPYRLHPMSPIRLGLRGSRMAGPLQNENGHWFRIGQDCRAHYGAGMVIFRIEELSPKSYRETEVETLGPDAVAPGALGVHTLSRLGPIVAIDCLSRRLAPIASSS